MLWRQIQQGEVDKTTWRRGEAFEHLILRAFLLDAAQIIWPYEVRLRGDVVEQIDGTVYVDEFSCLIEAKDWQGNLDIAAIAKLHYQLRRRPSGVLGLVFSRRDFTEGAKLLASYQSPLQVLLWSGADVTWALQKGPGSMKEGLRLKYRHAVELGLPDLDLAGEESS